MASCDASMPPRLPDEMFNITKTACNGIGPRLGRLTLPGRDAIETPHYLGNASRGVVPHLSQDTFTRSTSISGIYASLEDFIERAPDRIPPLYKLTPAEGSSPMRTFVALPEPVLLVLGARRTPPVLAPPATSNTDAAVAVSTSVGFRFLSAQDYAMQAERLGADIAIGLIDVPYGRALSPKRITKATDRSIDWLHSHVSHRQRFGEGSQTKLFASLLPVPCASQRHYVDALAEELQDHIAGLAFYSLDTMRDLPVNLRDLPRIGFTEPTSPHQLLQHVRNGIDLSTIPFIGAATDAGIALDFSFPSAGAQRGEILPLGVDMWSPSHATDLSPLRSDCTCYACTTFHRAYMQHLLSAKEMLGWVLLQIHNHHVVDSLFTGIRRSIAASTFDADMEAFNLMYEHRLPEKTGQGPRVRGYQFKSEGPGEPKKNVAPFTTLCKEDRKPNGADEAVSDALVAPDLGIDSIALQVQRVAEKWEE